MQMGTMNPGMRLVISTIVMLVAIAFWGYRIWAFDETIRAQSWAAQESVRLLVTMPEDEVLDSALETVTVAADTMQMITWMGAAYGVMIACSAFVICEETRRFRRANPSA